MNELESEAGQKEDRPERPPATAGGGRVGVWRGVLVVYWLLLATATHIPGQPPDEKPEYGPTDLMLLLQWDKPIHVSAFGLLCILMMRAWIFGQGRSMRANALLATAAAIIYAAIDESTQTFAMYRTVSAWDMLANLVGIMLGYLWVMGVPEADKLQLNADRKTRWLLAGCWAFAFVLAYAWRGESFFGLIAVGLFTAFAAWRGFAILLLRTESPRSRWAALVGALVGVVLIANLIEGLRMLADHPINYDYQFANHVGVGLLVVLLVAKALRHHGQVDRETYGQPEHVADRGV